jgi:hypothetical protein
MAGGRQSGSSDVGFKVDSRCGDAGEKSRTGADRGLDFFEA